MSTRVLLRDYTVEEMDRGEGMEFHPVEGSTIQRGTSDLLPRIGDGQPHKVGDMYPKHWKYDPFTGHWLDAQILSEKEWSSLDDDVISGEW